MALKRFVSAKTVNELVQKGFVNKEGIRILDCSYAIPQRLDWKLYRDELYGKFELLLKHPTPSIKLYLAGHIPGAVHMNLDAAVYPSKYERFTMYEPEMFEKYAQLLGINKGEHLILYSRGPLGGMLFAAKCAWLFKAYGHEAISIVDGGWQQWFDNDYEVSMDNVFLPEGNWRAQNRLKTHTISFEELEKKNEEGKELIERTDEINFLDSRGRGQFEGTEDTGLDPYRVNGTHIPGFKNCPASELLTPNGLIRPEDEISLWLKKNGYKSEQPVVTSCNMGLTASFLAYAIEDLVHGIPRLYSGSLKEVEIRAPLKISAGPQHIPPQRASL